MVTGEKVRPTKAKDDKPKHEGRDDPVVSPDENRQGDQGDGQDDGEQGGRHRDHPRGGPPGRLKRDDAEAILPPPGHRKHDDNQGDNQGDQPGDQQGDGHAGGGDSRLLVAPVPPAERQ